MWSIENRDRWKDLDDLQEPNDAGRALYAGGFILADSFDTILRNLSEEYLERAWARASGIMTRYEIAPVDLSWGFFHPGETFVPGVESDPQLFAPSDFIGWSSRELYRPYDDSILEPINVELAYGTPKLAYVATWRTLKWDIQPNDYAMALRLIEMECLVEPTEWSLDHVLQEGRKKMEPWVKVAQALRDDNQGQLDAVLDEVRRVYTPIGYRIVLEGYAGFLALGVVSTTIRLPSVE